MGPPLAQDSEQTAFSAKVGNDSHALRNYGFWARENSGRKGILPYYRRLLEGARKAILRMNEAPASKDGRHIDLDALRKKALVDERYGREYISNSIRSSRHTAWNFLPRQLFAQFSKLANFYFLCISILQLIPTLSTTGTFTTIAPLMFFVGISMAKEGYEDLRRHRLDKADNNRQTSVLRADSSPTDSSDSTANAQSWTAIRWHEVSVGDIVRLKRDDATPADLILLRASGPNGTAYIETMALDGETNLKGKQAAPALAKACASMDGLLRTSAHLIVEDPNADLYSFEGKVTTSGETQPLTTNEVVYRGSVLRNTAEAIGVVIYTGEECKIRMNATKNPRIKAPSLQGRVNRIVIVIVLFVLALAVFNTVAYLIWADDTEKGSWYLENARVPVFPVLASFVIMFNTLIPLSLYVSLEIVKLAQIFLMNDIDMYDEASDTPMEARTSTINEELGQVSYIFSDKTGTLTNNSMRFRKLSVAGTSWLHNFDILRDEAEHDNPEKLDRKKRIGKIPARTSTSQTSLHENSRRSDVALERGQMLHETSEILSPTSPRKTPGRQSRLQPELTTTELLEYLQRKPETEFAGMVRFFILCMALCHTCLPETRDDGELTYQAASPDELALVQSARELGYVVVDRQAETITLKTFPAGPDGEAVFSVYEILDVIEFSSQRKRMSVIVRFPDHRIYVISKGADSTITELLKSSRLALEKASQVERRASKRKSMEAKQMLRNSMQIRRKSSEKGPSVTLARASIGALDRRSMTAEDLQPIRHQVDAWLSNREHEADVSLADDNSEYFQPRASAHFGFRRSFAASDRRSLTPGAVADALVDEGLSADEGFVFDRCFQHINEFATEGLRTLMYAYRTLDEQEYAAWRKVYHGATTSLVDRQEQIERAGAMLEKDLELAGATAIEDKLQDGVPETIDKLRRANIKMWMLTGDKRETAINIGRSCRLIKDYSVVTVLDHEEGDIGRHVAAAVVDINSGDVAHSVVVVDGQTLAVIEDDEVLKSVFVDLAILVDSVICCRASPSQKAQLVRTIRKKVSGSVTLAIGDGANDIAMIQEAHVGIGITGKEGLQAARTSDYSIAQFRFLLKLLLVHGRWNYVRTCKYTLSTFWKEMVFYLTQALYQRWAGYTGTSLYESWSLSMFNSLFTSLPVIFIGVFEKDLLASTLLAVPELYTKGQRGAAFNFKVYLWWIFMGSCEAMVIFFVMLGLYGQTIFTQDNGLYAMGVLTYTACVVLIATKILLIEMHNKSIVALLGVVLSVGGWFLWNLVLSALYKNNVVYNVRDGLLKRFGENALWWLVLILVVTACVVFEIGVASLQSAWFPTDADIFQEYEHDAGLRRRFEEAAASELRQGRDRGEAATQAEDDDGGDDDEAGKAASSTQSVREKEIQDLLYRPRVMEGGRPSD
ncbi:MAG: hypothetical protein M1832_003416 [Thelocarpon impressellum]|nr:MAG: hypothetical protein M1832_003416 [Thelocarpon impressellum]